MWGESHCLYYWLSYFTMLQNWDGTWDILPSMSNHWNKILSSNYLEILLKLDLIPSYCLKIIFTGVIKLNHGLRAQSKLYIHGEPKKPSSSKLWLWSSGRCGSETWNDLPKVTLQISTDLELKCRYFVIPSQMFFYCKSDNLCLWEVYGIVPVT